MTTLIVGGMGFIGRRLAALLASRDEDVVVMDVGEAARSFAEGMLNVNSVKADVTRLDEVVDVVSSVRPNRVVNLAYFVGSNVPPHRALALNVVGMGNCFEASRLFGIGRVVYGSSFAVSGDQSHFGHRPVVEDDTCFGSNQYAHHKIFNEWHALDYREKYGMDIVGIRPASVTGSDKVLGLVDHVQCVTGPARGEVVRFPFKDQMRCIIHVDDVAEAFARVLLAERVSHHIYNTGGTAISLGELATMVREFVPSAQVDFDKEKGAKLGNYLIENKRLRLEFGLTYPPLRERVRDIIEEVRHEGGV